ncbi:hypothetical protein [Aquimarina sp. 2201CG14-23]|uniref:hypothetical protein n=1 Tax=Aquimarina mycalae TaxID=3040073 RepID=UPI00247818F9|nr:hypothetical protein [Aquimarina sp. 2201CG14-23]MDH7447793.1 hypothetical protein [Aquimarina sp. 2201CG14-23]
MNNFIIISCLMLLLFCSCKTSDKSNEGWQMVFRNDENGQVTFGDKSKLIDAVRLGYPVRIGWGSNRVEHVATADFLTIFQGEEVFAQINTIVGQAPRIDGDSLKIRFRTQNHWTKISGTNGYSTGFMTNYFQDTIAGGGTDRYTATTWYVQFPSHQLDIEALPLWRKESPNWEKWKKKEK